MGSHSPDRDAPDSMHPALSSLLTSPWNAPFGDGPLEPVIPSDCSHNRLSSRDVALRWIPATVARFVLLRGEKLGDRLSGLCRAFAHRSEERVTFMGFSTSKNSRRTSEEGAGALVGRHRFPGCRGGTLRDPCQLHVTIEA